jgi:hypothetical protein
MTVLKTITTTGGTRSFLCGSRRPAPAIHSFKL